MAFALAKSLSDDLGRRWASVGLYSMAVAAAWARVYDDVHWLSDVGAGACLGYFSAGFVGERWLPPRRGTSDDSPAFTLRPARNGLALVRRY